MVRDGPRPAVRRETEEVGQFIVPEAGGDTDVSVVAAHGVRTNGETESSEPRLEDAGAPRFAGDDEAGVLIELPAESAQFGGGKVMQEKVGTDERVAVPSVEGGEVDLMPGPMGGPAAGGRGEVERVEVVGAGELAVAGAELETR